MNQPPVSPKTQEINPKPEIITQAAFYAWADREIRRKMSPDEIKALALNFKRGPHLIEGKQVELGEVRKFLQSVCDLGEIEYEKALAAPTSKGSNKSK